MAAAKRYGCRRFFDSIVKRFSFEKILIAMKPEAKRLPIAVKEFLIRVEIMPWDYDAAEAYARLRTSCESEGTPLGTMDMLIAAHSVAVGAVLVTSDQAFYNVKQDLSLQDWTRSHDR